MNEPRNWIFTFEYFSSRLYFFNLLYQPHSTFDVFIWVLSEPFIHQNESAPVVSVTENKYDNKSLFATLSIMMWQ